MYDHVPCMSARMFTQWSFLTADYYSDAEFIATIDSDCVFYTPVIPSVLFHEGKVILASHETHQRNLWKDDTEFFVGQRTFIGSHIVTQPITFKRSSIIEYRKWSEKTRGECFENTFDAYLRKFKINHSFCWCCLVGTYLEMKNDPAYEYVHYANASTTKMVRFSAHMQYEPKGSPTDQEYNSIANRIMKKGICRAFGALPEFQKHCEGVTFDEINYLTFSYDTMPVPWSQEDKDKTLSQYLDQISMFLQPER